MSGFAYRFVGGLVTGALLALPAASAVGAAESAARLIATQKPAVGIVLPAHAKPGTGVVGALDPAVLDSPQLAIPLPGGTVVSARQTHVARNDAEQKLSWTGTVAGTTEGLVVLTRYRGTLAGFVHWDGRVFEVQPAAGGQYVLYQVDPTRVATSDEVLRPSITTEGRQKVSDSVVGALSAELSPVVQDLLVVYTAASATRYGPATLESKIVSAVAMANAAYRASGVNITLNLVGMRQVAVVEGASMSDTLAALKGNPEVAALREQTRADLVQLINENTGVGGIAYMMGANTPQFSEFAFGAVGSNNLGGHTLVHEIGHNQGLAHDRETSAGGNGVFPYSYGYRRCVDDGNAFMDIMSYACTNGVFVAQTGQFANPSLTFRGYPTGISYELDPANSADGARSLNETAATVASYRQAGVSVPAAPSALTATVRSPGSIVLGWTVNSNDAVGFKVERSAGGAGFTEIASFQSSGATYFTDNSVVPNTVYSYRVRAYNSGGVSEYSNVVTAVVEGAARPPATPGSLVPTVTSGGEVRLTWVDSSDNEDGFRIERSAEGAAFTEIGAVGSNVTQYVDSSAAPATGYVYRVRAFNGVGSSDYVTSARVVTAQLPPAAPSGLTGTVVSSGEVRLDWTDNAGNESGFRVERSVDGANFTVIGSVGANVTNYIDRAAVAAAIYVYRVCAVNSAGEACITTGGRVVMPVAPPAAPSGLVATAVSSRQVDLAWQAGTGNETRYTIERSVGGPFSVIGSVSADLRNYSDTAAQAGTTYGYRVQAHNGGGDSGYSNVATVTTPVPLPLTPGGLTASNNRKKTAAVSWQPVEDPPASRYELMREMYKKKKWSYAAVVATVPSGGSLTFIDASGTGTFRYSVRACNGAGCSAYSAPVQVKVTK